METGRKRELKKMSDLHIMLNTFLTICAGVTCVAGGVSVIVKLLNPFRDLRKKVEEHERIINREKEQFDELESTIKGTDEYNKAICKALLVLLNHEITGNGIDKLKEQRDELEHFLINK